MPVEVVDTRALRRSATRRAISAASSAAAIPAKPARQLTRSLSKLVHSSAKRLAASSTKRLSTKKTPPASPSETLTDSPDTDENASGRTANSPLATTAEDDSVVQNLTATSLASPASEASSWSRLAPAAPAAVEVSILKHGVPWRGTYARKMVVGGNKITTIDPVSELETNAWATPRDAPRATSKVHANGATIELQVAPWPEAPEWLHQRFRCSAIGRAEGHALLGALEAAGVHVEAMA